MIAFQFCAIGYFVIGLLCAYVSLVLDKRAKTNADKATETAITTFIAWPFWLFVGAIYFGEKGIKRYYQSL